MKAYFMEVNENEVVLAGYVSEMKVEDNTLKNYVGGVFCMIPITQEFVLIANQTNERIYEKYGLSIEKIEQKKGLPLNRAIVENQKVKQYLFGNLICIRRQNGAFVSIEDEDVEVIKKYIKPAFRLGKTIMVPNNM